MYNYETTLYHEIYKKASVFPHFIFYCNDLEIHLTYFYNCDIFPTMKNITSRDNKILKHTKKLAKTAYRAKAGEFVAEGERLCAEALNFAHTMISYAILTAEFFESNRKFQKKLDDLNISIYIVSEMLFADIAQTTTPQGILFVVKTPLESPRDFADISRALILDGISEPGNMGTIIRTADAFGFRTIILANDCVDVYNPKVVRASMGGIFRASFVKADDISLTMNELKSAGFQLVATALDNAQDVTEFKFNKKCALIIGSEASGVSNELLKECDATVKIPMANDAESLNAAVAAGIVMYVGRDLPKR